MSDEPRFLFLRFLRVPRQAWLATQGDSAVLAQQLGKELYVDPTALEGFNRPSFCSSSYESMTVRSALSRPAFKCWPFFGDNEGIQEESGRVWRAELYFTG
jgi:hypothetical protein